MTERYYDPSDPADKEYNAKVYDLAVNFIPTFLRRWNGCAYLGDIRVGFEQMYSELCDDTILRSETSRQPKWYHSLDNALNNLQIQGTVIGGSSTDEPELWCLS
jgi:hypothetical protein